MGSVLSIYFVGSAGGLSTKGMDKMGQLHPKDDDEMDPEEDTYL